MSAPVRRRLSVPFVIAALLVSMAVAPMRSATPAGAQATNRAAVIVHTGGSSSAVCIRFSEASISGMEALQRAGMGAVTRTFGGQGAAVCGLNGVGCPADGSCLTCQAPQYWAYHRAGPGAGGFSRSASGAGGTAVVDGSVEGWQWGTGAAPPFQSVDQVCGPEAPRPSPAPETPAPGTRNQGGPAPGAPSSSGQGPGGPSSDSTSGSTARGGEAPSDDASGASATTVPGSTTPGDTTTSVPDGSADGVSDTEAADAESTEGADVAAELAAATADGGGGSVLATVLTIVIVLGLVIAAVTLWLRRQV